MGRFHLCLLLSVVAGLAAVAPVHAAPVRGLIVQLKPVDGAGAPAVRELPQVARERLAATAAAAGLAVREQRFVGAAGHQLLRLAQPLEGDPLQTAMRRLRLHPDVASVEADELLQPAETQPNDPDYALRQWYLKTPAQGGAAAINLPPAWDLLRGDESVAVAVLDTGVRFDHPDLLPVAQGGRLLPGYDFASEVEFANDGDGRDADASDPGDWITAAEASGATFAGCAVTASSWHGTFIAGQIGAQTDNSLGVAGVSWRNRVLPVRVAGKCGALLSDVIDGMRWAAGLPVAGAPPNPTPARVINLSFVGGAPCASLNGIPSVYQAAIDELSAVGALLVVAAGNDNSRPARPADCRDVLAVGAVQQDGLKTYYANYGPEIGLTAPGGSSYGDAATQLYSTTNAGLQGPGPNTWGSRLGTSFSTPLVSGVAAMMLSRHPALTPAQLAQRLRAAARPHAAVAHAPNCSLLTPPAVPCNCTTDTCGAGLLDADRALQLALGPVAVVAPVASVTPGTQVTLDASASLATAGTTLVAYEWSLVSGSPVAIADANRAIARVTLSTEGSWSFRVVVRDSAGRQDDALLTVTAARPAALGGGGGGGAMGGLADLALGALVGWAVLRRRRA